MRAGFALTGRLRELSPRRRVRRLHVAAAIARKRRKRPHVVHVAAERLVIAEPHGELDRRDQRRGRHVAESRFAGTHETSTMKVMPPPGHT
jgi:hypothetical protein